VLSAGTVVTSINDMTMLSNAKFTNQNFSHVANNRGPRQQDYEML
jgi:hypothetical protein